MKHERITEGSAWSDPRGQVMKTPDDVAEVLRLRACGWGLKRIARQLGCSHHAVKGYVAAGGAKPFKSPERSKRLDGLGASCSPIRLDPVPVPPAAFIITPMKFAMTR